MAWFIVRVQLVDADDADYDILHDEMEKCGFVKETTFTTHENKIVLRQLPHAEYFSDSELDGDVIRSRAKAAALSTGFKARIIVIKTNQILSYNLEAA